MEIIINKNRLLSNTIYRNIVTCGLAKQNEYESDVALLSSR